MLIVQTVLLMDFKIEMDFKVEEPWNTEKYCRLPWLSDKKNFWILDALEWLKQ